MNINQHNITVATSGRGFFNITAEVNTKVNEAKIKSGLCNVFLQHTSASLIFCENADPDVQKDLEAFFLRLIPDGDRLFKHDAEGPDDMPAHVRTVLTQNSLTIPIIQSKLALGTWQGIYLWEHRYGSFQRHIIISLLGH